MPSFRWQSVRRRLLICGLTLAVGCASSPLANRFRSSEREPILSDADTEIEEDESPRSAHSQSRLRPDQKDSAFRNPTTASKSTSNNKPLDPATQMLIDSELRELPSAERTVWKDYLASVAPESIPRLLQQRVEGVIPPEVSSRLATINTELPEDEQLEIAADSSRKQHSDSTTSAKISPAGFTDLADRTTQQFEDGKQIEDERIESEPGSPEIVQIGNEVTDEDKPRSEIEESSSRQVGVTLKRPVESPSPSRGSVKSIGNPAIETETDADAELSADVNHEPSVVDQTAMTEPEEPGSERRMIDQIRIWPQGKRPELTLSDRLAGPLTPRWSREARAAANEKESKSRSRSGRSAAAPIEKPPLEPVVKTDPKADYWQDELRKLISLMEAEAARPPADDSAAERQAHIQRQVYLRMLYLMAAEPEKAQLPIDDVEAVDQEFWTSMFWGMSNYFDDEQIGAPGTRAAQTIAQLHSAARQLQSIADLELRNVSFCQHIDGWGLYERFERDDFEPGQDVLLYGELRNFATEATASGYYRTLIGSTIEIVRTGQEDAVLDSHDLGTTEDLCRGLRTDFYNSYRFTLPAHLTTGSYQLRLTIEDQLSGRLTTQTIGFSIH